MFDIQELENRIDEFLEFHNSLEKEFGKKLANQREIELVSMLKEIVKESSEECTLPDQIRLNKRIATLLMDLGTIASERVKQANIAFRWVKWKKHKEWTPVKNILKQRIEKVLVGDIEEEVAKRTFAEEMIESNIQGLADWLVSLHKDIHAYRSAFQRQIDYNMKNYDFAKYTAE